MQFNIAPKARYGKPKSREGYFVGFIEVLQRTEDVNALADGFSAKPKLIGSSKAGSTITCEPNVKGASDVRYFWYADSYPLTWGSRNTYTVTADDAGKEIRCMVKAVGRRQSA